MNEEALKILDVEIARCRDARLLAKKIGSSYAARAYEMTVGFLAEVRAKIAALPAPPAPTNAQAFETWKASLSRSRISPELENAPVVAVLAGATTLMEIIVRTAAKESGMPMDWGYVGGRAVVHCHGDREAARYALWAAFPQHDGLGTDDCPKN